MSEVKRFVVDRSKWHRGLNRSPARLIRSDTGKMCCLGFVCLQSGVSCDALVDRAEPDGIDDDEAGAVMDFLVQDGEDKPYNINTSLAVRAIDINDSTELFDDEREARLATLFADHGYEMVFVDGEKAS